MSTDTAHDELIALIAAALRGRLRLGPRPHRATRRTPEIIERAVEHIEIAHYKLVLEHPDDSPQVQRCSDAGCIAVATRRGYRTTAAARRAPSPCATLTTRGVDTPTSTSPRP